MSVYKYELLPELKSIFKLMKIHDALSFSKSIMLLLGTEIRNDRTVNCFIENSHLYNYCSNNPVRYIDPDGNDIINNTDKYIIARLEDPITIKINKKKITIDTLVIPPHSVAYGAFDGARDEDGRYFKVSCHSIIFSFPTVDFEIDKDGNMIIKGFPEVLNNAADNKKIKKNKQRAPEKQLLLSGKKTPYSSDYKELQDEWDTQFINDLNFSDHSIGNSERWEQEYHSERQKKLRKKIKIKSMEEIERFDQIMHNSHIY